MLRLIHLQRLDDLIHVWNIAQRMSQWVLNPRNRRDDWTCTRRKQQKIIAFIILRLIEQITHSYGLCGTINAQHFIHGAHIHVKTR
ncbi:Uncharacterised protein [Vibrio cholerae]|uniref:Uncharacterized protein n=1 Tax=Vibrio cholerae TaxID=666 RepID=A0A655VLW3_VIBCL|nr:Uncharacterised protein [Vibrio cholerae]